MRLYSKSNNKILIENIPDTSKIQHKTVSSPLAQYQKNQAVNQHIIPHQFNPSYLMNSFSNNSIIPTTKNVLNKMNVTTNQGVSLQ